MPVLIAAPGGRQTRRFPGGARGYASAMTTNPYDHRTEEQRLLDAQEPETLDRPVEAGAAELRDTADRAADHRPPQDGEHEHHSHREP